MNEAEPHIAPIERRLELLEEARLLGLHRVLGFWRDGGSLILETHPDILLEPDRARTLLGQLPAGSLIVTGLSAYRVDADRLRVLLDGIQMRAGELEDPQLLANTVELAELVTAELLRGTVSDDSPPSHAAGLTIRPRAEPSHGMSAVLEPDSMHGAGDGFPGSGLP